MPNRTIYISDADLPIFEKAQQLAGDNLSATIVKALRRFVEMQDERAQGFAEVTVKVGKQVHSQKRFTGRLLARGRFRSSSEHRSDVFEIYETQKGNIALYTRNVPDWFSWGREGGHDEDWWNRSWANPANWGDWESWRGEHSLDVFPALEALKERIPQELYVVAEQNLKHGPVETLDI